MAYKRKTENKSAAGEQPFPAENSKNKLFFHHSNECPLSGKDAPKIDYKDITLLSRYVSERGKIMPRRISSICSKKQRELAQAIKRARILALMPFINN